jgi:hypothetical protein
MTVSSLRLTISTISSTSRLDTSNKRFRGESGRAGGVFSAGDGLSVDTTNDSWRELRRGGLAALATRRSFSSISASGNGLRLLEILNEGNAWND